MKRNFFLSFLVLQYVYKNTVNIKILLNKDSSEFCGYKYCFSVKKVSGDWVEFILRNPGCDVTLVVAWLRRFCLQ